MQLLLDAKTLGPVVSGLETFPDRVFRSNDYKAWKFDDAQAKAWMYENLEDSQQNHLKGCENSHAMWEALRKVHDLFEQGKLIFLKRRFPGLRGWLQQVGRWRWQQFYLAANEKSEMSRQRRRSRIWMLPSPWSLRLIMRFTRWPSSTSRRKRCFGMSLPQKNPPSWTILNQTCLQNKRPSFNDHLAVGIFLIDFILMMQFGIFRNFFSHRTRGKFVRKTRQQKQKSITPTASN